MSLKDKLRTCASIAIVGLAPILYSGCASTGEPSLNPNDWVRKVSGKDPETGQPTSGDHFTDAGRAVILGAGMRHLGQQAAAKTGNQGYVTASDFVADTTTKSIDYQQTSQQVSAQPEVIQPQPTTSQSFTRYSSNPEQVQTDRNYKLVALKSNPDGTYTELYTNLNDGTYVKINASKPNAEALR